MSGQGTNDSPDKSSPTGEPDPNTSKSTTNKINKPEPSSRWDPLREERSKFDRQSAWRRRGQEINSRLGSLSTSGSNRSQWKPPTSYSVQRRMNEQKLQQIRQTNTIRDQGMVPSSQETVPKTSPLDMDDEVVAPPVYRVGEVVLCNGDVTGYATIHVEILEYKCSLNPTYYVKSIRSGRCFHATPRYLKRDPDSISKVTQNLPHWSTPHNAPSQNKGLISFSSQTEMSTLSLLTPDQLKNKQSDAGTVATAESTMVDSFALYSESTDTSSYARSLQLGTRQRSLAASGTTNHYTESQPLASIQASRIAAVPAPLTSVTYVPAGGSVVSEFASNSVVNQTTPIQRANSVPTKGAGAPKAVLHAVYGRPPRRKVISQESYFTWHDGGPPHELKWTSVFVCPITGEVFPSGPMAGQTFAFGAGPTQDVTSYPQPGEMLVWYSKKTTAEHGAAARAVDCIVSREPATQTPGVTFGMEEPYPFEQQKQLPTSMPLPLRRRAEEIITKCRRQQEIERQIAENPSF